MVFRFFFCSSYFTNSFKNLRNYCRVLYFFLYFEIFGTFLMLEFFNGLTSKNNLNVSVHFFVLLYFNFFWDFLCYLIFFCSDFRFSIFCNLFRFFLIFLFLLKTCVKHSNGFFWVFPIFFFNSIIFCY